MLKDTIYIVGAGAIGKVLAVFLKLEGKDVVLIRGSVPDGKKSIESVEVELSDGTVAQAELETVTFNHFSRLNGVMLFTNKSYGNTQLAKLVYPKIGLSPIVILQNGLHVEQPFVTEGFPSIYRCVLFATSHPVSENRFRFKPVAPSPIGMVRGSADSVKEIVQTVGNRYFPFKEEPEIDQVVWTKTIVNCVFNSICPLLETDNGIFHRNEMALSLAKRLIVECLVVANAMGILLREEEVVDMLLRISKSSEGQLISTYQDLKLKRRTEIETLNIAIVDVARKLLLPDAVKETGLLGDLILLKSELSRMV